MLRIISQDGMRSCPYEKRIVAYKFEENITPRHMGDIPGMYNVVLNGVKLGSYDALGKARCVISRINEAWMASKEDYFVFRLPSDEDMNDKACRTCKWGRLWKQDVTGNWGYNCLIGTGLDGKDNNGIDCKDWENDNE